MKSKLSLFNRMVSWFSCGAASAVAAKIAVDTYASEYELHVVYCDTSADEHPDNERFLEDVQSWIGHEITRIRNDRYANIYDVFRQDRYIVGPSGARCSKVLKRQVRDRYALPGDVHILGFTSDEETRIADFSAHSSQIDAEWVLRDRGITKADCFHILNAAGIEIPEMYNLGFSHNNCLGCVKGGMGYWNKIRIQWPDRFATMATVEREIGATILRRKGERLYLDELRPEDGRDTEDGPPACGFDCSYDQYIAKAKLKRTPTETPLAGGQADDITADVAPHNAKELAK